MIRLFATKAQREIITCSARKMGVFAGRRWGKTDTFFNRCVKRCLSGKPIEYVYVAPSYGLAKEQYERIETSLGKFILRAVGQPKPRIELINGSRIHFRSFDKPKYCRGLRRIAEIWVDEIQDIVEKHFWSVLRPMLSDVRGTLVVSGQFRGLNWYYRKFYEPGQQPGQNYCKSWRLPSSTGLIYQDAAGKQELLDAKKDLTKQEFDQEYECVPIANQSAVFTPEDIQAITRGQAIDVAESGHRYIIAYDLGEMIDPSAMCVVDVDTRTVVKAEKIALRTKHELQAKALAQHARRWNGAAVVIDGTAGGTGGHRSADEIVKFYRAQLPNVHVMIWEPSVKAELVRRTQLCIEAQGISIPATHTSMLEELAAYECERRADSFIYHGADGGHDDQVAALMMAIWALKAGWAPSQGGRPLSSLMP